MGRPNAEMVVKAGIDEDAVGGVEAVVEEAPVQVELKAGVGVEEGEVFPEADVGGEAAGGEAAGGINELVAQRGEKFDLFGQTCGLGEGGRGHRRGEHAGWRRAVARAERPLGWIRSGWPG